MKKLITHRNTCRGCNSNEVIKFLSLGKMPLAGGFLDKNQIYKELKIPLDVYVCKHCLLVQILDIVSPQVLFKNYFYISSVIKSLSDHFKDYSNFLKQNYLKGSGKKILEFGCNDGVLLQYFSGKEIIAIGIDPSENVSQMARDKGFNVITGFFNRESAYKIKKTYGTIDVVTGSNVFAHTDDIGEIIEATKVVLNEEGVFIIEVHYLIDLLEGLQYDTIYHEHLTYYSITSLSKIFSLYGMKIIDVHHLSMHGGGIRVIVAKENSKLNPTSAVLKFITKEKQLGISDINTYKKFGENVVNHKSDLISLLKSLKKQNKRILGYGAPGRGTILLNYCNISNKYLDYIVDISPLRAGKLMPGVHIPIFYPEIARQDKFDFFLVLARNYTDSIIEQERELRNKNIKFIIPFPQIHII